MSTNKFKIALAIGAMLVAVFSSVAVASATEGSALPDPDSGCCAPQR